MEKQINPTEIIANLKKEIINFEPRIDNADIGVVLQCADGIVQVSGIGGVMAGEIVEIEVSDSERIPGVAMNLDEYSVGVILLGDFLKVKEGQTVRRSKKVFQVPAGDQLLGRVIDPLGNPLDDKPLKKPDTTVLVERKAPGIIDREDVKEPLYTGLKVIDALIPIGRGQRELIIGDRRTGKTSIAIDAIINQQFCDDEPVRCFYVAIGQKRSSVLRVVEKLREYGAMKYTTVVCATASDPAPLQYIAPYSACAMAEFYRDRGQHALVVYDDLTKHAQAYRQISLLLRRPPGREAYPGDIFYLHSRLLERAAKLSKEKGGGSLTALPIIETQAGDVSAYIPTNVISITDGQIFLESSLFNSGLRPAVNVGISVSRVGGSAQIKATKQVAGSLRLDLAQYRELASFSQFASDLDKATQAQLARGEKLTELLKQKQYMPLDIALQIMILFAGSRGWIDKYPTNKIIAYERHLIQYLKLKHSNFLNELKNKKAFDEKLESKARQILSEFDSTFNPELSYEDIDSGISLALSAAISQAGIPNRSELLRIIEKFAEKSLPADKMVKDDIDRLFEEQLNKIDESDFFDNLIRKSKVLDISGVLSLDELFEKVSDRIAEEVSSSPDNVIKKLKEREKLASTALTAELAVPHCVIEGSEKFSILPVRMKNGINMSINAPNVHIFFFICGSIDMRNLHLKCLAAIAQLAGNKDFADQWMQAAGAEELRNLIISSKRVRNKNS